MVGKINKLFGYISSHHAIYEKEEFQKKPFNKNLPSIRLREFLY
jgi:hypothetical protein